MYFRDLGPQLGWTMVFLAEYIGPLLTYLLFYFRVPYIYSHRYDLTSSPHPVVTDGTSLRVWSGSETVVVTPWLMRHDPSGAMGQMISISFSP
ncbi:very-long-chain enoyl-CoA reductase-like isoform X1 [Lates japonicus]|uniref:Very-long-chain enoyl-CoA reductase-like isoform X1 n=1 Tax=Lates japonicus TaxID=270547 RepID=A0AAD3MXG2_LATJO|nr:very-long-chain enoyl-CoA reductase-like isoform X1 [Lates japonicus]